ncbi:MAG: aminodeoxychorismate synthase, component I [Candidatus Omnitrophica bacterium]|nr:aminodeoxychorismate synthase, component I [Candidatus Omnitrophota bacterium]
MKDTNKSTSGNATVVLRDARQGWMTFVHPVRTAAAYRVNEVRAVLESAAKWSAGGGYAAGFVGYESAAAFDPALRTRQHSSRIPLVWFGLYKDYLPMRGIPDAGGGGGHFPDWHPLCSANEYAQALCAVKEHIECGLTYQVNYSFRLRARFSGDCWTFFQRLVRAHESTYPVYVSTHDFSVCSASPELFFRLDGQRIFSAPMKGTMSRGLTPEGDVRMRRGLNTAKHRAENIMIVDMVRNDLGKIARPGSVSVPALFRAERYPTVWQMVSRVQARTRAGIPEIFGALFPAASITGAPKAKTMELIAGLETTPRGVYTGAAGYIGPERTAQFNVAIRTVTVDHLSGTAEYGTGGGIVWDSEREAEYRECLLKAEVLTRDEPSFELFETLLWEPSRGFFLLSAHLRRMRRSARYFGYAYHEKRMMSCLNEYVRHLPRAKHRIKILLNAEGQFSCAGEPFQSVTGPRTVGLAPFSIDRQCRYLYHKTTRRAVYERARAACPGPDDVLLRNPAGEVTESTIANVVVQLKGRRYTPPVECGLLPGTFRRYALDSGMVTEKVIRVEDLFRAEALFLCNSVRGIYPVTLVGEEGSSSPVAASGMAGSWKNPNGSG